MATIDFNMVITDEAVQYAREASTNPGWYLIPTRWAISSSSGTLSSTRTTSSMLTTWINEPYSGLEASGTTGILHSIVIPPDAYETEMSIGEIYFIYKDYYGNEFLFAIAQPTSSVIFTPGVSQQYYFLFKLNNVDVSDTIIIDYTYPQDIEDHNQKEDAHDYLLARNGSRTATGILYYESEFDFTENLQIPSKQYVDEADNTINNTINNLSNTVSNLSTTVSNLSTTVSNNMTNNGIYTTTYISGTTGYRAYYSNSSKTTRVFLIQWGRGSVGRNGTTTVSLPLSFANTNYNVTATWLSSQNKDDNCVPHTFTTSSFKVYGTESGANDSWGSSTFCWQAIGT